MFRRAKSVISRELSRTIPAEVPERSPAAPLPSPVLIKPGGPDDVPVLDPTRYSERRRKRGHVMRYRLAELTTGLSVVGTIAAITCLSLGDRQLGQVTTVVAVLLGLIAIAISWPTRLSSRVLGYAMAATIVAALSATVALALPASWFDEPSPDKPVKMDPTRKRRG
jgi:hypothetical protein